VHPRPDNFGVALLSRMPLEEPTLMRIGDTPMPSVMARVRHQGRSLLVVGMHPPPPLSARHAVVRDRPLSALVDVVVQRGVAVVVLGDFYAGLSSARMHGLFAVWLGHLRLVGPYAATCMVLTPLLILTRDVLWTALLVIVTRNVGPNVLL